MYLLWGVLLMVVAGNRCSKDPHCASCLADEYSYMICEKCDAGYFVRNSYCLNCYLITSHCKECKLIDSSLACTECLAGYSRTPSSSCQLSCKVLNCKECHPEDEDNCVQCAVNFEKMIHTVLSVVTCVPSRCSSSDQVFNGRKCVCPDTLYFNSTSNLCQPCRAQNCINCGVQPGNCLVCSVGYYLNETSCAACSYQCVLCLDAMHCLRCKGGYSLRVDSCIPTSTTTRQEGSLGSYTGPDGNSFLCFEFCQECTDSQTCLGCFPGFILFQKECKSCSHNCLACAAPNSDCILCLQRSALLNGSCVSCISPLCSICIRNPFYCERCTVGYTSSMEGSCVACGKNCGNCTLKGPGLCDSYGCEPGFRVALNGKCEPCIEGIAKCETKVTESQGCLVDSYSIEADKEEKCLLCGHACLQCLPINTCSICREYYELVNGSCLIYESLPCLQFASDQLSDSIEKKCVRCLKGYTLVKQLCTFNLSCNQTDNCKSCPLQFVLLSGKCLHCNQNCYYCVLETNVPSIDSDSYLNFVVCQTCLNGYYLINHQCLECDMGCKRCISQHFCQQCIEGYFMEYLMKYNTPIDRHCRPCSSSCKKCNNSPERCTACYDLHHLDNTKCHPNIKAVFTVVMYDSSKPDQQLLEDILTNLISFTSNLCKVFGKKFMKHPELVQISRLSLGSVIVEGSAYIDQPKRAIIVYMHIKARMAATNRIGPYTVISSTMLASSENPYQPIHSPPQVGLSVYARIIIVVSSSLLFLLLMGFLFYRAKRGQISAMDDEDDDTTVNQVKEGDESEAEDKSAFQT